VTSPRREPRLRVGTSPQELETGTLTALRSAVGTLQVKAPGDVAAYKAFAAGVAQSVPTAVSGVRSF
jgi:hypothetical protein